MIEAIGWLGGLLFALCAAPQALQCVRQGHAQGISSAFLAMWVGGECLSLTYVVMALDADAPLVANYAMNLGFTGAIAFYKLFPRKMVIDEHARG